MEDLNKFINDQLSVWPLAAAGFRAVKNAETKSFTIDNQKVTVQFNPERITSSTADVTKEAIAARQCFLCVDKRPPEQFHIKFEGRKGRRYNIQVNPYPIFPSHLVIAREEHIPQAIWHNLPDALDFAAGYEGFSVFYNGPMSGASAPDHLHFQACPRHLLPLEDSVDSFLNCPGNPLATVREASIYHYPHYCRGIFALKAATAKSITKLFYRLLECTGTPESESEPRFNLFAWHNGKEYRCMVILRTAIRSHHYYAEGAEHLTMSPGAADMAGMFIAPKKEDFLKVDAEMLTRMLSEVTVDKTAEELVIWRLTRSQRKIDIGIMSGKSIDFEIISDGAGRQTVSWKDGRIDYNGTLYDELYFDSVTRSTLFAEASFILYGVTIGIEFHWQQQRDLRYAGSLRFIVEGDHITAVNRIGLEDYLLSVISSEMKSSAGLELLKAHAVISRSWCLCNLGRHGAYDLCADDHCQRYQGVAMAAGDNVRKAIDQTWGKVLRHNGSLCDTRYSKCCGGITERFGACWEDMDFPYLQPVADNDGGRDFCDCQDETILSQVLNDYDLVTRDFYRWRVIYGSRELSELIRRKTGKDIGTVRNLEPLERGASGRIIRLRISGDNGEITIGKELAIRKALSDSHLKSSAFDITRQGDDFILDGKGWGHGVGLCQIGAAVMAAKGYGYDEILHHYYPNTDIDEI